MTTPETGNMITNINEPINGWIPLNFKELWQYRDLFLFLSWRNIQVRYKQSILGIGWALVQPVLTMIVFSIVLGDMIEVATGDIPYPIFSYAGLLPWTLFTTNLSHATSSLVYNATMVKKIYFPRVILPISAILAGVADFFIALLVLFGMMIYYQVPLTLNILWLPVFVLLTTLSSLTISLWFSALNVWFRDIQYIVPFIIRLGLFLTPALYPTTLVSEKWQVIYNLNPLVSIINGFRWAMLGSGDVSFSDLFVSNTILFVFLIGGLYYFRRVEMSFADVI